VGRLAGTNPSAILFRRHQFRFTELGRWAEVSATANNPHPHGWGLLSFARATLIGRLMNQPTRSLIAYAVLAERISGGGDLFSALIPFFKPICVGRSGESFVPREFAAEFERLYAIRMPTLVAAGLADRMERDGLLVGFAGRSGTRAYTYGSVTHMAANDQAVVEICADYRSFVRGRLNIDWDDEQLDEHFFRRLLDVESLSILAGRDRRLTPKRSSDTLQVRDKEESLAVHDDARQVDYATAQFLLSVREHDLGKFVKIESIGFANLAAEALLTFQDPPGSRDAFANVDIYLDAPLVLDMLGANPGREEYGQELISLLKQSGARTRVFLHSILEAERVIRARKNSYLFEGQGAISRFSPDPPETREIIVSLDGHVESFVRDVLGIEVEDPPQVSQALRITFTPEDEAAMRTQMDSWGTEDAKDADVRSVIAVAQLRGMTSPPSRISDARALCVTRNPVLAGIANTRWRDALRSRNDAFVIKRAAPLFISEKHLAGLIWLSTGGKGEAVVRARIVANCEAAIHPRRDTAVRAYNLLLDVDRERAKQFETIIQDQRIQRALGDRVLGDYHVITPENVVSVVDDLLGAQAKEVTRLKDEEIAALRHQHSLRLKQAGEQIVQHQLNLSARDDQIENLSARVREFEEAQFNSQVSLVRRAFDAGYARGRTFEFWISVLLLVVGIVVGVLISRVAKPHLLGLPADNFHFVDVVAALLAGFPLAWKVPDLAFGNVRRRISIKAYQGRARDLGVDELLSSFIADFDKGALAPRQDSAPAELTL
jgi:hypothetical protein